jgi:hypothetical protein
MSPCEWFAVGCAVAAPLSVIGIAICSRANGPDSKEPDHPPVQEVEKVGIPAFWKKFSEE